MTPPLLSDMHTSLLGVLRLAYSCSLESFFKLKYNQICMLRSVFTCGKLICGEGGWKLWFFNSPRKYVVWKVFCMYPNYILTLSFLLLLCHFYFSGYWFNWMCSSLFPVSRYEQRMKDYSKINCITIYSKSFLISV